jgi:hypothetical protein
MWAAHGLAATLTMARNVRTRYTDKPQCQFHGLAWVRPSRDLWPVLQRDGWKDTLKYGWVCPACLGGRHADHLARLAAREHEPAAVDTP